MKLICKNKKGRMLTIYMYIFTVFIYKKDLQYLWKASRRHQTHPYLPSFVLVRGLPMDTVRGAHAVAECSPNYDIFSPLSHEAFPWATDQFSSLLNTENVTLSGSVPWLYNYVSFPLLSLYFLWTLQNSSPCYCQLKLNGKSSVLKVCL